MRNNCEVVDGIVTIALGKELFATTDITSFEKLKTFDVRWYPHFDYNRYYAYASIKGKTVKMHRFITEAPIGLVVDHVDGDSLNNQISNLRVCSQLVNGHNRTTLNINNSSGVRGVSFHKASGKWRAAIRYNHKQIHVGLFESKEEATLAIEERRKTLFEEESA